MRLRSAFLVKTVEPRLAFEGTDHARDVGDRRVTAVAMPQEGAGTITFVVSKEDAGRFAVGRIITVEIAEPPLDPKFATIDDEVGR